MVSELGSQVENAVTSGDNHDPSEDISKTNDKASIDTSSVESVSNFERSQSESSGDNNAMVIENNGELVVGDRFWTVFCNEVERVFEAVRRPEPYEFESHSHSTPNSDSHDMSHINYYKFLLRQADATAKYDLLHPPPSQMLFLWQTFVDDIDPFLKVLHVPSMTRLIRDLRGQYHSLGPGTEALIFGISLAAISVLNEQDVRVHNS
ncbi:hypothetical protein ABW20_dc0109414 [Dactylellina cionopaga]|nr:hypothetical protein ABW20_dc0109414 [Dactylellina cionopaga]